jgi:phage protein D
MAVQKSPHTQSQQNTHFAQTDVNPDELEQTVGTGEDAATYENRNGAQTGGTRSPRHSPGSRAPHKVEPAAAAYEGTLTSRVFDDANKQGISNNASSKEAEGQRKVVSQRDDSQAGVNHSGKTPKH